MNRAEIARAGEAPAGAMRAAVIRPAGSRGSVFRVVLSHSDGNTCCLGPLLTLDVAEMLCVSAYAFGLIEPEGAWLCEVRREPA